MQYKCYSIRSKASWSSCRFGTHPTSARSFSKPFLSDRFFSEHSYYYYYNCCHTYERPPRHHWNCQRKWMPTSLSRGRMNAQQEEKLRSSNPTLNKGLNESWCPDNTQPGETLDPLITGNYHRQVLRLYQHELQHGRLARYLPSQATDRFSLALLQYSRVHLTYLRNPPVNNLPECTYKQPTTLDHGRIGCWLILPQQGGCCRQGRKRQHMLHGACLRAWQPSASKKSSTM